MSTMGLGCLVLVILCSVPVAGQWYNSCLPNNFNCVTLRVKGIGFSPKVTYEVITEIFNYDARRQIIVKDISGYSYGDVSDLIVSERDIYDYKKKVQYRIVRPQIGRDSCQVLSFPSQFRNACIPDGGQEVWLKSPLGYNGDMVPTIRFKWITDNSSTELMWTYTGQPITQTHYGMWNDGVFGYIPVFETNSYTNITNTDPGPDTFTPPSFCNEAEIQARTHDVEDNDIFLF